MSEQSADQSLISLLDDIAQAVKDAKSRFPGSTLAAIDRDYVLDLIYSAREAVPDQLSRADELLAEAEDEKSGANAQAQEIVRQAHVDADEILREAREQASRLVAKDAVTVAATQESQRIVDDAKSQADKLRRGADDYSDQTLASLQATLSEVDSSVVSLVASLRERFDAISEQIEGGRSVIAERSEAKPTLRPSSPEGKNSESAGEGNVPDLAEGESVEILGPVPPELAESPEEGEVHKVEGGAFSVEEKLTSPSLAETAPEPADEDYR